MNDKLSNCSNSSNYESILRIIGAKPRYISIPNYDGSFTKCKSGYKYKGHYISINKDYLTIDFKSIPIKDLNLHELLTRLNE